METNMKHAVRSQSLALERLSETVVVEMIVQIFFNSQVRGDSRAAAAAGPSGGELDCRRATPPP